MKKTRGSHAPVVTIGKTLLDTKFDLTLGNEQAGIKKGHSAADANRRKRNKGRS